MQNRSSILPHMAALGLVTVTMIVAGCSSGEPASKSTSTFPDARAESTPMGEHVLTKVIAIEDGSVLATALWDTSRGTGSMDVGAEHVTLRLDDSGELSLEEANAMAYRAWISATRSGAATEGDAP